VLILFLTGCAVLAAASLMPSEQDKHLAREIYKEMVDTKSGFTTGQTTPIAEAVAARLKGAGFPELDIFVGGAIPTKYNVVVRYHGTGTHKPILLLAHTDVVEERPAGRRSAASSTRLARSHGASCGEVAGHELHAAYDVCGDDAGGRPCAECFAAVSRREYELPHFPRRQC
jgi:hypothetical protein